MKWNIQSFHWGNFACGGPLLTVSDVWIVSSSYFLSFKEEKRPHVAVIKDIATVLPCSVSNFFSYFSIICEILRRVCYIISCRLNQSLLFIPGHSPFCLSRVSIFSRFSARCSLSITENQEISMARFAQSCDFLPLHAPPPPPPPLRPSCPCILFALQDCGELSMDSSLAGKNLSYWACPSKGHPSLSRVLHIKTFST